MKICAFTRSLPVHGVGGLEEHAEALFAGLAARGHDLTIITSRHPHGVDTERRNGAAVHYLASTISGRYELGYWRRSAVLFNELHRDARFDAVCSESIAALGYLRSAGRGRHRQVPTVLISHGTIGGDIADSVRMRSLGPRSPFRVARSVVGRFSWERTAYRRAAAVIAVSEAVRATVARRIGVPPDLLSVVPNGIDTKLFRPSVSARIQMRSRIGLHDSDRVAVYMGRLDRAKGVHLLPALARKLATMVPDARVVIAGAGPCEGHLRARLARESPRKRPLLLGRVDHGDVPAVLAAADVLILPTLEREGLPLSVAEAMACGLPVVASDVPGVREIIDSGVEGLLVPRGDVRQLCCAVAELLSDGGLSQRMGRAAMAKVRERYTLQQMIQGVETVLYRAAGLSQSSGSLSPLITRAPGQHGDPPC